MQCVQLKLVFQQRLISLTSLRRATTLRCEKTARLPLKSLRRRNNISSRTPATCLFEREGDLGDADVSSFGSCLSASSAPQARATDPCPFYCSRCGFHRARRRAAARCRRRRHPQVRNGTLSLSWSQNLALVRAIVRELGHRRLRANPNRRGLPISFEVLPTSRHTAKYTMTVLDRTFIRLCIQK